MHASFNFSFVSLSLSVSLFQTAKRAVFGFWVSNLTREKKCGIFAIILWKSLPLYSHLHNVLCWIKHQVSFFRRYHAYPEYGSEFSKWLKWQLKHSHTHTKHIVDGTVSFTFIFSLQLVEWSVSNFVLYKDTLSSPYSTVYIFLYSQCVCVCLPFYAFYVLLLRMLITARYLPMLLTFVTCVRDVL